MNHMSYPKNLLKIVVYKAEFLNFMRKFLSLRRCGARKRRRWQKFSCIFSAHAELLPVSVGCSPPPPVQKATTQPGKNKLGTTTGEIDNWGRQLGKSPKHNYLVPNPRMSVFLRHLFKEDQRWRMVIEDYPALGIRYNPAQGIRGGLTHRRKWLKIKIWFWETSWLAPPNSRPKIFLNSDKCFVQVPNRFFSSATSVYQSPDNWTINNKYFARWLRFRLCSAKPSAHLGYWS